MKKNKPYIIVLFVLMIVLIAQNNSIAQIYNIATEDGTSINTCEGIFTDSDDFDDDIYINNEEYMLTFCSDEPGECVAFEFTSFDVPDLDDWLYVWDGADTTTGTFIGQFNNPFGSSENNIMSLYPDGIESTSGCMTFVFISDGDFSTGTGWEANISCNTTCATCFDGIQNGAETGIDCGGICEACPEPINIADGGTVNTCQSEFTDSGGITGTYENNEANTITICSDNPNPSFCLQATFSQFSTEGFWDYLYIYDGPSISSPVIGAYTGTNSPGSIVASGSCLTFYFDSDNIINNYPGWIAQISCGECAAEPVPSIADCAGALTICNEIENQPVPEDGSGNVNNELPANACFMTEINALWYVFDVASDGIFNFSLDADPQINGDYDWALYDITGLDCDDLSSATSISCNTYGLFSGSGDVPTGISTANGGTGNANGPGDINGPAFNEDVDVLTGETYALVISNCCNATAGFEIDFGGSTADIYDSYPPVVQDVIPSCANNQVSIAFNEQIDCTTISELDFQVTGADGTYNALSSSADWCDAGLEGTLTIDLFLDGVLNENDVYVLDITDVDGGVADLCGNAITDGSFAFNTSTALSINAVTTPSDCAGTVATGSAEITVIGGDAPYYVEMGTQNDYDVDVYFFDNLLDGPQQVDVYDFSGCQATFYVDIPSSNSTMDNDITISNVSCIGGDGEIEIFTQGGVGFGPWEYQLTDTNGVVLGMASNTDYFYQDDLDEGAYFISVEDLSGLSPCSDLQELIVGPPDSIIINMTNDTSICYNGQAEFTGWVSGGNDSPFTLYYDDGSNQFTNIPGQLVSTGVLTDDLTYVIYAQDDLGCSSDSVYYNVYVNELITFDVSPDQIVCVNTSLTIGVDNISGGYGSGYEVYWDLGNSIIIPEDSVIVQPEEATQYCVYISDACETPDVDSCIIISPTLEVPISFSIDSDTTSCPPHLVNFTNTTDPTEVESATWIFGDGTQSQSMNDAYNIYDQSGNYNVGLEIITPEGCVFDTMIYNAIIIYPVPHPFFVMDPSITTLQNTEVNFDNQSIGGTSFHWIFDTINNLGESIEEDPIFVFPDIFADEYYIRLNVMNDFGCESFITQMLIINEDQTLYIPNSFTPNGDGKNDYFYVEGVELDPNHFSLMIFDRWGKVVFETNDINAKWNGSVNGSSYFAQPGVFSYFLSYKAKNTLEAKELQGSINLLK